MLTTANISRFMAYLILESTASKGPDSSKHKVQLVQLFGAVWWGVLGCEEAVKQVAQHLNVTHLHNWRDLLEARLHCIEAHGHILVEEDQKVGLL